MTMKEKSNIEQHERKKNEGKEEYITYIYTVLAKIIEPPNKFHLY